MVNRAFHPGDWSTDGRDAMRRNDKHLCPTHSMPTTSHTGRKETQHEGVTGDIQAEYVK